MGDKKKYFKYLASIYFFVCHYRTKDVHTYGTVVPFSREKYSRIIDAKNN